MKKKSLRNQDYLMMMKMAESEKIVEYKKLKNKKKKFGLKYIHCQRQTVIYLTMKLVKSH